MTHALPEVTEAEAGGSVAGAYAEIRAAFGLPFVMLVYRHLAAEPGRLESVWQELRPNVGDAALDEAAAELTALASARIAPISPAALAAIGVGLEERDTIRATFAAYADANPRNLVLLAALLAGVGGTGAHRPVAAAANAAPLLPMAELAALEPAVRALLEEMAGPFTAAGDALAVPSLFRHLAHRPALLALVWGSLRPLADGRRLAWLGNVLAARAGRLAATLPHRVRRVEEPSTRAALERFTVTIARMAVAAVSLRDAVPR